MDTDYLDSKNDFTTAKAAAIGSGNEIGYWTKTWTENKSELRTPQQHPLASVRVPFMCARASYGAG